MQPLKNPARKCDIGSCSCMYITTSRPREANACSEIHQCCKQRCCTCQRTACVCLAPQRGKEDQNIVHQKPSCETQSSKFTMQAQPPSMGHFPVPCVCSCMCLHVSPMPGVLMAFSCVFYTPGNCHKGGLRNWHKRYVEFCPRWFVNMATMVATQLYLSARLAYCFHYTAIQNSNQTLLGFQIVLEMNECSQVSTSVCSKTICRMEAIVPV